MNTGDNPKVKILVEVLPEMPYHCPFCDCYKLEDWIRVDCHIRRIQYPTPTPRRYYTDENKRQIIGNRLHCRLIYGEECPYLKPISAVLP